MCVSENSGDNRWGGGWCAQGTGSGIGAHDDTYSFDSGVLPRFIGKHTLKVGAKYRILRNNYYQSNDPAGLFQFNAKMTAANPQQLGQRHPGLAAAAGGQWLCFVPARLRG